MLSTNETAGFNHGPALRYEPSDVADLVIWPLVNDKWQGDWLTDSSQGNNLRFPKSHVLDGIRFDVELVAECEAWKETDGEMVLTRSGRLFIEETLEGVARTIALESMRTKLFEAAALIDSDLDGGTDDTLTWPEGDESQFSVRRGSGYHFDSDGDDFLERYHSIQSPITKIEVAQTIPDTVILTSQNLGEIEVACYVL